jgi:integrase
MVNGKYEVRGEYYDRTGERHGIKRRFDRKGEAADFVRDYGGEEARARDMRFSAWVDNWFAIYQTTKKLEWLTILTYTRIIGRMKKHFGAMPLNAIKPTDIEMFYLRLMSPHAEKVKDYEAQYKLEPLTDKPLSATTTQPYHAVIHLIFKYALRDELVKYNLAERVTRPASSTQEITPPEIEAIQAALDALRGTVRYLPTCIAAFAGMRAEEVLGLQWDCVDLVASSVEVRRTRIRVGRKYCEQITGDERGARIDLPGMDGWILRNRPKGKRNRSLRIPDELVCLLRNEQKRQKASRIKFGSSYAVSDFVCVHDDGKPIAGGLSSVLKDFRFHDLRHANASYLIDAGEPLSEVSRRIGHSNVYTTAKTYVHALKTQDERAAKSASRIYKP